MTTAKFKTMFFDRAAVVAAVGKASAAALSKAGAYVRTAARSSIRKRKNPSPAGQPPSSHTGLLKDYIFFGYDTSNESVVIGPAALNQVNRDAAGGVAQGLAPPVLEFGGSQSIYERQYRDGTWGRVDQRRRSLPPGTKTRVRRATYAARPFMRPALEQEAPKFPELWSNSLRS